MGIDQIIHGDALEEMRKLPSDSVDCEVTDPPYGYSFMGKDWDKAVPSVEVWKESLRVLKAGAFAFVMSSPRQDVLSQMIVRLGEAGFDMGFTSIYWAYASGFPKAMNIGKAVDKRNGRQPEQYKELGEYLRVKRGVRPQKEIAQLFPSKTGGLTGCVANWELGLNVPTKEQWLILKRELQLDSRFDSLIEREEAKREVIGKSETGASEFMGSKLKGKGEGRGNEVLKYDITVPATDKAKLLDGSYGGFQPKPALEIILVCMKPLETKTYVDQALKNGHGVTWLDNARIPYQNEAELEGRKRGVLKSEPLGRNDVYSKMDAVDTDQYINPNGRFPANLLVSDDILNDGTLHKRGDLLPHHILSADSEGNKIKNIYGEYKRQVENYYGDSGSFSRYFSLDTWFSETVKKLPKEVRETYPFLICPKASKGERNEGLEKLPSKRSLVTNFQAESVPYRMENGVATNLKAVTYHKNIHPTVKPLALMSYLITLGSRPKDMILDPFVGSGTTCLAAKMLGRHFIGIEKEAEYIKICEARVNGLKTLFEFKGVMP